MMVPEMPWTARQPADDELAAGPDGTESLRCLTGVALAALRAGERARGGPAPAGGPETVRARWRGAVPEVLPAVGVGPVAAVRTVVGALATGSVNPAHTKCAAHLHAPSLAVAAVADFMASVLNPSMDSWDQAPVASVMEEDVCRAMARLVYADHLAPDAFITTGGTESNLLGLLLARQHAGTQHGLPVQVVCGDNAHHSVGRAAWLLGLPPPVVVPCPDGRLDPERVAEAMARTPGPLAVVATAGTTDRGSIDPLRELAGLARAYHAWFHVDAAYGGCALFSPRLNTLLTGIDQADSVALDLHKFGWQPLAAGLLAVASRGYGRALEIQADYLNADDDVESGLPDLLSRSLRTSRRPDVLKIAATFQTLGRTGLADLVERCCDSAAKLADRVAARPDLVLLERPELSTVLFRPVAADRLGGEAGDTLVADVRRRLLDRGDAVLGRATLGDRVWLKITVLHPHASAEDFEELLDLVAAELACLPDAA